MNKNVAMQIQLLGTPTVWRHGEAVRLAGRQPALLAALALEAPRVVSAGRLVEVLWGDDLPADPANALQQRISSLRRALGAQHGAQLLVTETGGYALRADPQDIDIRQFATLISEGRACWQRGDAAATVRALSAALALVQGPALDPFVDEAWASADAARLEALRRSAIELRAEAVLADGGGDEVIEDLREVLAEEPLRERAAGLLMRSLARAGRQAEALACYEELRTRLADELGVDPDPGLQQVHVRLLQQADEPTGSAAAGPAPSGPASTPIDRSDDDSWPRGNIPQPIGAIIGRDQHAKRVESLWTSGRLVTLIGPGGVGKTTLACEVMRGVGEPAAGCWLVELGPVTQGSAVAATIAATLPIGTGMPGAPGIAVDQLATALADRKLALLIDNCEHLLDDVAPLVEQLLARTRHLRILATSRQPLGVAGELIWQVPPLALPDNDPRQQAIEPRLDPSVPPAPSSDAALVQQVFDAPATALFLARWRPGVGVNDLDASEAGLVEQIVRQVDGIPLAIELAAARARTRSLTDVAAGLSDRFSLLSAGRRTAPERHRTLRAALDWSWELLDEVHRLAWAALSVPVGRFTAQTAHHLLDEVGEAQGMSTGAVLDELVDRSLLVVEPTSPATLGRATEHRGASTVTRYRMLVSLRDYGQQRLEELDLHDAVRRSHAEFLLATLSAANPVVDPARFGADLDALADHLDEARAALQWAETIGDQPLILAIAARLGWRWLLGGLAAEGIRWLDVGFGADHGAPPSGLDAASVEPTALLWASALRATGNSTHGRAWAELSLACELHPTDRIVAACMAAVHLAHAGNIDSCLVELDGVITDAQAYGGWPLGFAHVIRAQMARLAGRIDQVRTDAWTALELLTDAGVDWARVQAIDIVIDDLEDRAEHRAAVELATEGLQLARRQQMPGLEARMWVQLAAANHELGEVPLAAACVDQAIASSITAGRDPSHGYILLVAGSLARRRGALDRARHHLDEADALITASMAGYPAAWVAVERSLTASADGRLEEAGRQAVVALRVARGVQDPSMLARAVIALAITEALAQRRDAAVGHGRLARQLLAATDSQLPPAGREDLEWLQQLVAESAIKDDPSVGEVPDVGHLVAMLDAVLADLLAPTVAEQQGEVKG